MKVKFWAMVNGQDVRITLRRGKPLSHVCGGPTEEGFSYTTNVWYIDGRVVRRGVITNARDCDGRMSHYQDLVCRIRDLKRGYCDPETGIKFPKWQTERELQRDYEAEKAGY